jgi:ATP-dependent Lon protease
LNYQNDENDKNTEEEALAQTVEDSVREDLQQREKGEHDVPDELYIIPLTRRPFFPGMAAPLVIEPGHYYEVLKNVAKTEHKSMGLFLTKNEEVNIYKVGFEDLYQVGVMARILRIIPMEQGGAQVVLRK